MSSRPLPPGRFEENNPCSSSSPLNTMAKSSAGELIGYLMFSGLLHLPPAAGAPDTALLDVAPLAFVKVLLSSGYSINGQAAKILEQGCKGFIQKPFTLKQLSEKVNEILKKLSV